MSWIIGVDVGGTFTDFFAYEVGSRTLHVHKTASSPDLPHEAIIEGFRALCGEHGIAPAAVERLEHGTTVGTNTLIQRRGGRVALITTAGFRDLLEIGRQIRPHMYSFQKDYPRPLVPRELRFEVAERVTAGGKILRPLDERAAQEVAEAVARLDVDACAICFLFAFQEPAHERRMGEILAAIKLDLFVSLSSDVQPEFREYERLSTTVLNAYLQPVVSDYLNRLEATLKEEVPGASVGISMSRGGLMSLGRARRFPVRTALSGPAAGVMGAIHIARLAGRPDFVTLDMGGTSADVCLVRDYRAAVATSRTVADFPVRLPAIDIETIGAGGGSIAWFDRDGLMKIGPMSAGASPGPACYGTGGLEPTVSDANLILGRLSPKGLIGGRMPLDVEAARAAFRPAAECLGFTIERTAQGAIAIVVANMVRSLRTVSVERGFDPRQLTLLAFGGAGPLHASEVAQSLGIREILVPPSPGILCAQGLVISDLKEDFVLSKRVALTDEARPTIATNVEGLLAQARAWLREERIDPVDGSVEIALDMRYVGQNFELPVLIEATLAAIRLPPSAALRQNFFELHERHYGYSNPDDLVEIVNFRLTVTARLKYADRPAPAGVRSGGPEPVGSRRVYFAETAPESAQVFDRAMLAPGDEITGPAVIEQLDFDNHRLPARPRSGRRCPQSPDRARVMSDRTSVPDPITLEILHNALLSVTEEAYAALMKSAYSANIKERHDHSVMLVDAAGRLVAQPAQSLPIHLASGLGMMRVLLGKFAAHEIRDGDIFAANDPYVAGGTHLPDINLAMPVFAEGRLLCWICNIAHHADMGGVAPGSMASDLTEIYAEGLRLPVVKLLDRGELVQDILEIMLLNARVPEERRGDYYAQISSCRLGARRMKELAATYPPELLEVAFGQIIERTRSRMRASIRQIPPGVYVNEDYLDHDGHGNCDLPIRLRIVVGDGTITLDFRGSSPQVKGNINATFNALQSVVCYTLKALLDEDVPNNQGVLESFEIICDDASIVNAAFPAAVASRTAPCQRIADMIVEAIKDVVPQLAVAHSNGSNTAAIFAGTDPRSGRQYVYIETLGGGFGGRATKDGKDGVQVHITNTSNLPVEAIELEYPLLVESYELVPDSAGPGKYRGGAGLRRTIRPVGHEAIFTGLVERTRHRPRGVFGGGEGALGRFAMLDHGREVELPSKPGRVPFGPDQCIVIQTPGAGGYGDPRERDPERLAEDARSGLMSADYLVRHYGYRPDSDSKA